MMIDSTSLAALYLSLKLAAVSTVVLMGIGIPLAWWLAHSRTRLKPLAEAIVALPLVLPPTVIGFYLLIALAPSAPLGQFWENLTGNRLAFSFEALVIGSVIYSLPFVVQPLQARFSAITQDLRDTAAMLGCNGVQTIRRVIIPMCSPSLCLAATMGFAHTIGEFGVVLMIGGNIAGQTQVLSIHIFEQVETLQYANAHQLSAVLLLCSVALLSGIYTWQRKVATHA